MFPLLVLLSRTFIINSEASDIPLANSLCMKYYYYISKKKGVKNDFVSNRLFISFAAQMFFKSHNAPGQIHDIHWNLL